jgi:poly-beta-1,6-N-acetyl-D-glucosamine synthase
MALFELSVFWLEVFGWLASFSFAYPMAMAWIWMAGAIGFYLRHERGMPMRANGLQAAQARARLLDEALPRVSILLPCFNEEAQVEEVVASLMELNYPDYEVLAVNDGSSDNTGAILNRLAERFVRLRVVHLASNQGKAIGLNTATALASGTVLVGIDGDAILDPDALAWMVYHFLGDASLGAVTGNPRIRTRSTVLGRLQVAEFSSIVGLIKRAQQAFFGHLFTVSGVVVALRRSAVEAVGGWSDDMLTEDIDISWKLQTRGWQLRFEPRALVWILMPETLRGLWKQRLRWAMGGVQVVRKYAAGVSNWKLRTLWPVFLEYCMSIVWAFCMAATLVLTGWLQLGALLGVANPDLTTRFPVFGWAGMGMALTCLVQFSLSLYMDRRYDHRLARHMSVSIWYPIAFWVIIMLTAVVALPKVLWQGSGKRATWVSPDRGLYRPGAGA